VVDEATVGGGDAGAAFNQADMAFVREGTELDFAGSTMRHGGRKEEGKITKVTNFALTKLPTTN
jgi:hypothetical protein